MEHDERARAPSEQSSELTDFPVGVSASRSIRDYEAPSTARSFSSGFRSSASWERVV
jgi:hypothetical protein